MGPEVGIFGYKVFSKQEIEKWLAMIAFEIHYDSGYWEFCVNDATSLGYVYKGKGTFFIEIAKLEEKEQYILRKYLNPMPKQVFHMGSFYNSFEEHLILGYMALNLVIKVNGLIDFCGAITPKSFGEKPKWQLKEAKDFLETFPGKLIRIPEKGSGSKLCEHHLLDADFFRAWLAHPKFHMIK